MGLLNRAKIAGLAAAVAVLAAVSVAPAALADVNVSPYRVRPGENVRVRSHMEERCWDVDLSASSEAFAAGSVTLRPRRSMAVGWTEIARTAGAGRYTVEITCDGGTYVDFGTLVVADDQEPEEIHGDGGGFAVTGRDTTAAPAPAANESGDLLLGAGIMVMLGAAVVALSVLAGRSRSRRL